MFEIAVCSLLGMLLGTRFRVGILFPAALLAALIILAIGIAEGQDFWRHLAAQILGLVDLQLGYLAGLLLKPKRELVLSNHS